MAPDMVAIVDGSVYKPCSLVAIVFPVVHSDTLEGPFFMCFIRQNVRGLR